MAKLTLTVRPVYVLNVVNWAKRHKLSLFVGHKKIKSAFGYTSIAVYGGNAQIGRLEKVGHRPWEFIPSQLSTLTRYNFDSDLQ